MSIYIWIFVGSVGLAWLYLAVGKSVERRIKKWAGVPVDKSQSEYLAFHLPPQPNITTTYKAMNYMEPVPYPG